MDTKKNKITHADYLKKPIDVVFDSKGNDFNSFEFVFSNVPYLNGIRILKCKEHGLSIDFYYNFKELCKIDLGVLPTFEIFDEFFDLDMKLMFRLKDVFKDKKSVRVFTELTDDESYVEDLIRSKYKSDVNCSLNKTSNFKVYVSVKFIEKEFSSMSFQDFKHLSLELTFEFEKYYKTYFDLLKN